MFSERTQPPGKPPFYLYGHMMIMPQEMYDLAFHMAPVGAGGPNGGYANEEEAIRRIEATLHEYFPGGFYPAAYQRLALPDKAHVTAVMFISTLTGVYRYPITEPRPPVADKRA